MAGCRLFLALLPVAARFAAARRCARKARGIDDAAGLKRMAPPAFLGPELVGSRSSPQAAPELPDPPHGLSQLAADSFMPAASPPI